MDLATLSPLPLCYKDNTPVESDKHSFTIVLSSIDFPFITNMPLCISIPNKNTILRISDCGQKSWATYIFTLGGGHQMKP